jgi:membrane protein implicated in regulation of membrane protease activity
MFWLWLVLGAIFIIGEIFTAGFFLFWFAIGAGLAAVLSLLGASLIWQLVVFFVVGLVGFIGSRRFAERITRGVELRVGAERFVGKKGYVTELVDAREGSGRVRVEGEEWKASPATADSIEEGTEVLILRVEGNHLVVRAVPVK